MYFLNWLQILLEVTSNQISVGLSGNLIVIPGYALLSEFLQKLRLLTNASKIPFDNSSM